MTTVPCEHLEVRLMVDGDEPGVVGRRFECSTCREATTVPASWLNPGCHLLFWECHEDVMWHGSFANKRFTVICFTLPDGGAMGGEFSTV